MIDVTTLEPAFRRWFIEEEIHEVIANRNQLVMEHLHTYQKDMHDVHIAISKMVQDAYMQGRNDIVQ